MVHTPVSAKCPRCARMPKAALVRIKPDRLVKMVAAGLGAGAVGGYVFGLLVTSLSLFAFFAIMIAFGLGAGVGEAVSRASGRFHGTQVAGWAAACAAFGIVFPFFLTGFNAFGLTAATIDYVISVGGIWKLLWMAAAAYGAWQRNA